MAVWTGVFVFAAVMFVVMGIDAGRREELARLAGRLGASDRASELERRLAEADRWRLGAWLVRRLASLRVPGGVGRRLALAGVALKPEEFYAAQVTATAVATGLALTLSLAGVGAAGLGITLVVGGTAYMAPVLWLNRRIQARRRAVRRELLAFVDLLAVATEAGLPLMDAIRHVAEQAGGVLGHEFGRAVAEARMGTPQAAALAAVGDRLGVDDLSHVLAALVEAGRTGTPVAGVLRQQAAAIRQVRQLQAHELAQKTGAKMLGPVILCIFLPMMVIILGPAAIALVRTLWG